MIKKKKAESFFVKLLLLIGGIIVSLPFIWMIISSFKPESEIMQLVPTLLPKQFTLENYTKLFKEMNFAVYLKNTIIIVAFSFIGLFLNAMAGYAFAKYEFPKKDKIFYLVLATMMIPSQVTMIPVYMILNYMGLTNTLIGIALPGMVAGFSVFLFKQFMTTIPDEILEAARLEGASEFYIFFKIVIPMSKPILSVQAILTFIGAWNSFLWPLIMANEESLYTLSVGLSLLKGQNTASYGLQMAGSALMIVPIVIIFSIFQKHIIDGYSLSGMK